MRLLRIRDVSLTHLAILFIGIISFALLTCYFIVKQVAYMSYEEVDAVILKVGTIDIGDHDETPITDYIVYRYTVDGRLYTTNMNVVAKTFDEEGDVVKIRYNPDNPMEIEDIFESQILILLMLFSGLYSLMLSVIIFKDTGQRHKFFCRPDGSGL